MRGWRLLGLGLVAALVVALAAPARADRSVAAGTFPATLSVDPSSGAPGDRITFRGEEHPVACRGPALTITVTLADQTVAETGADVDGAFVVEATVPSVAAGAHEAVAICRASSDEPVLSTASTPFEVLAPRPVPSPTPDPTGTPTREPVPRSTPTRATSPGPAPVTPGPSTASDEPTPTPTPAEVPAAGETVDPPTEGSASDNDGPERVTNPDAWSASDAIPDMTQVEPDAESAAASVLAVALFVLLIGFPAVLFDGTFRKHYDQIVAGVRERAPSVHAASRSMTDRFPRLPLVAAAIIGGTCGLLLDPSVALDSRTVWLLVGLAGVAGLSSWLGWLPTKRRSDAYGNPGRYRAYPAAMFIALGCVVVSRAAGFNPGYLYGLLFAYDLRGRWSEEDDGSTFALGFAAVLVVGIVAWASLPLVRTTSGAGGAALALEAFVVGVTLAGIQGVVLGMLPFRFAPGRVVWEWNRRAFAAVYAAGAIAFWMLLSSPDRALFGLDGFSRPSGQAVVAFGVYAGLSLVFWQYWRQRAGVPARVDVKR